MSMTIGVLGSSGVGQTLAAGFAKHGYDVMIGSRAPEKLNEWQETNRQVKLGDFAHTAAHGEVLVLAVAGHAAEAALMLAGDLKGKIILDATNPISGPPINGMIQYSTGPNESLMEKLQAKFPEARFVKAFNSVGAAFMVNPSFPGGRPTMFIAGDDPAAKGRATEILNQFGWDAEDLGGANAAQAIEPLAKVWCAPGFLRNQWTHAFKLLKL